MQTHFSLSVVAELIILVSGLRSRSVSIIISVIVSLSVPFCSIRVCQIKRNNLYSSIYSLLCFYLVFADYTKYFYRMVR